MNNTCVQYIQVDTNENSDGSTLAIKVDFVSIYTRVFI